MHGQSQLTTEQIQDLDLQTQSRHDVVVRGWYSNISRFWNYEPEAFMNDEKKDSDHVNGDSEEKFGVIPPSPPLTLQPLESEDPAEDTPKKPDSGPNEEDQSETVSE